MPGAAFCRGDRGSGAQRRAWLRRGAMSGAEAGVESEGGGRLPTQVVSAGLGPAAGSSRTEDSRCWSARMN